MNCCVTIPYDPAWPALKWAKDCCPSYITNTADEQGRIVYYFTNEQEAMMFRLRWYD